MREDTAPSGASEAATQRGQSSVAEQDPPDAGQAGVTREDVERLAYSYWEARGGNGGSAEEDWYRAEQELMALARAVGRS